MLVYVVINSVVVIVLDALLYDVLNVEYTVVMVLRSDVTLVMLPLGDVCEMTDVCSVVDVLGFAVEFIVVTKVVEAVLGVVIGAVLVAVLLHMTLCSIQNIIIAYAIWLYMTLLRLR